MLSRKIQLTLFILLITLPAYTSHAQRACCSSPQPLHYWNLNEPGYNNDVILGYDPSLPQTLTASIEVVPIKLVFDNQISLDPTQSTCPSGPSALNLTFTSPLFQYAPYTVNGQYMGITQFMDAYQHANLWSKIVPDNHLLFSFRQYGVTDPTHVPSQVLNVPSSAGHATPAGCSAAGVVSLNTLFNFINNLLAYMPPNTIPVFVVYNTLMTETINGTTVYEGGKHYYAGALGGVPFALATFIDDHSIFDGITPTPLPATEQDVYDISHELAEIALDPTTSNTSPSWGHVGQVTTCSTQFEIADPLTGTGFTQPFNGFNYHFPDLGFISWFFRESPSQAVNNSYSFAGTFTSPAPPCP